MTVSPFICDSLTFGVKEVHPQPLSYGMTHTAVHHLTMQGSQLRGLVVHDAMDGNDMILVDD